MIAAAFHIALRIWSATEPSKFIVTGTRDAFLHYKELIATAKGATHSGGHLCVEKTLSEEII